MRHLVGLFISGTMTYSLNEFEEYSVYKQFALSIIANEVTKFQAKLHGAKIK